MRRAFTLVELLVVISIIAVLAAMLLPAIGLVKFQAYGSRCGSDKRQAIMAILSYAQDWDGIAPTCMKGNANQGKQYNMDGHSCTLSLWGQLFEYTGTMAIARCPADREAWNYWIDPLRLGHVADCPSPETCRGRPGLYMAWSNGFISQYQAPSGALNPGYRPFLLSRYTAVMRTKTVTIDGSPVNMYTGRRVSDGQPVTPVSDVNSPSISMVLGSTLLMDAQNPQSGPHRRGSSYFGWNLTSVDGAVRWRTRSLPSSGAYDGFLYNRFEE
jgi:prepilin-type N-terminal cleavage/methylation domain-containing protein